MIGHYLVTVDEAAEDRVLTSKLLGGVMLRGDTGERCLIGAVEDWYADEYKHHRARCQWVTCVQLPNTAWSRTLVGMRFDDLCRRFGSARTVAAIRNRILANQARRTLQPGFVRASL